MKDTTQIIIQDWTGKTLFEGSYLDEKDIDKVLDANRCDCDETMTELQHEMEVCPSCNDSGYSGDFEIYWKYPDLRDKDDNVYEYTNY